MSFVSTAVTLGILSLQPSVDPGAQEESETETTESVVEAEAPTAETTTEPIEDAHVAEAPPPSPPPPRVVRIELTPHVLRERVSWYEARDQKLKRNTVALGVATGCLAGMAGLMMLVQRDADSRAPTVVGSVFGASASVTGLATIVSAVVLGNHRNGKAHVMW